MSWAFGRQIYERTQPKGEVIGIDVNEEAIRTGREINRELGHTNHKMYLGDVMKMEDQFPELMGSFDAVIECGLLCSLKDDGSVEKAIKSLLNALKPGGKICFMESENKYEVRGSSEEMDQILDRWNELRVKGFYNRNLSDVRLGRRLPNLLHESGVKNIKVYVYTPPVWNPPYSEEMVRLYEDNIRRFDRRDPVHAKLRSIFSYSKASEEELNRLSDKVFEYHKEILSRMEKGIMSPIHLQLFPTVFGTKPLSN